MPDLTDDIARIAALRGKSPDSYVSQAKVLASVANRVPPGVLAGLFAVGDDPDAELTALDALPAASRGFITSAALNISACKYADALIAADGREGELIHLVGQVLREKTAEAQRRRLGAAHPPARRLA